MDIDIRAVPASLSSIKPYLMIHKQYKKRDAIVSYYAGQYAAQIGLKSKSSPEAKAFLLTVLDTLETMKKDLKHEEAVAIEDIGATHLEEEGLKLFDYADKEDRQGRFHKNMIKAFFTASHIFTIAESLRKELSEEIEEKMKYAKWKAVEIDHCMKSGIPPTPGRPGEGWMGRDSDTVSPAGDEQRQPSPKPTPKPRQNVDQPSQPPYPTGGVPVGYPPIGDPAAQSTGVGGSYPPAGQNQTSQGTGEATGEMERISQEDITKAQKMCKFASSSLEYEDVDGAIDYLTQALQLLKKT